MYGILKLSQCNAEARTISCLHSHTTGIQNRPFHISSADVLMKVTGLTKDKWAFRKDTVLTLSGSDDVKLILGGVDNHGTNLTSVEIIPGTW